MDDARQALDIVEASPNPEWQTGYAVGKHPWRRYFARGVDNLVNPSLLYVWLGTTLAIFMPSAAAAFLAWTETVNFFVDIMLSLVIATLMNALLLGTLGTTLGKFIFGVRIRETDGRGLSFSRAFRRELLVWFQGMGLGIPVLSLFMQAHAYYQLDHDGTTTWDEDMNLVVTHRPQTFPQIALWVVVAIALIAAKTVLIVMSRFAGA